MSGLKIKYFPLSTMKDTSSAEYFSSFKPTDKNKFIRSRNIKKLPVHFFMLQFNIFSQTFRNRVSRIYNPQCSFSPASLHFK